MKLSRISSWLALPLPDLGAGFHCCRIGLLEDIALTLESATSIRTHNQKVAFLQEILEIIK